MRLVSWATLRSATTNSSFPQKPETSCERAALAAGKIQERGCDADGVNIVHHHVRTLKGYPVRYSNRYAKSMPHKGVGTVPQESARFGASHKSGAPCCGAKYSALRNGSSAWSVFARERV